MNIKLCDDCNMYWEELNDGHICNGTLVRVQFNTDFAMAKWEFMETDIKMKIWDANCNTVYDKAPSFSCNWSFASFCNAPEHMIAKAVNLWEDQIFVEIHEDRYDASLEAFDIFDYETMRERQEKIQKGYRIDAELESIAEYYEEEETFLLSSEG